MAEAFASPFEEEQFGIVVPDIAESFSASTPSLSLAGVPTYDTPEESLSNLAGYVQQQVGQGRALGSAAIESGDFSGLEGEDVNKLRRDSRNVRDSYTENVDENIIDFVQTTTYPCFKK